MVAGLLNVSALSSSVNNCRLLKRGKDRVTHLMSLLLLSIDRTVWLIHESVNRKPLVFQTLLTLIYRVAREWRVVAGSSRQGPNFGNCDWILKKKMASSQDGTCPRDLWKERIAGIRERELLTCGGRLCQTWW